MSLDSVEGVEAAVISAEIRSKTVLYVALNFQEFE
jgi:hypothetical protein